MRAPTCRSWTPEIRSRNFEEVNQGISADGRADRGHALHCLRQARLRGAVPGGREDSRGGGPDLRGRLPGGGGQDARRQLLCPPSPAASVRRRTSARADACWANKGEPVAIGNLERFIADYRAHQRTAWPARRSLRPRARAWPSSAAVPPASAPPETWSRRAIAYASSRRCTNWAACSSTAFPSSACPRRS